MLSKLTRLLLAGSVLAAVVAVVSPASANPIGGGGVDCEQHSDHPECHVRAGSLMPGHSAGGGGEVSCSLEGQSVPCVTEQGWLGSDGCRYLLQPEAQPPPEADGPGGAYLPTCPGDSSDMRRSLVWIADAESPAALLAQIAVSRLSLPRPQVELSPAGAQLVRLPTWFWVAPQWWEPRSASASVPGATVTAVGSPQQVRWETGDGAVVVCHGAGTPYERAGDPASASPDCGHAYARSSASAPGGVFTLRATVTWEVTWSGLGMSGSEDPLFSTSTVDVAVAEVQTVIAP